MPILKYCIYVQSMKMQNIMPNIMPNESKTVVKFTCKLKMEKKNQLFIMKGKPMNMKKTFILLWIQ